MVFVNPGEASSAQSSSISLQESSWELLAWLMAEIARRKAQQQSESEEESQEETPEEPPVAKVEEEWSPDRFMEGIEQQVMAAAAVKLVQDYGQNDRYQAEGYSIKAQSVDGKEIYTVRDQAHETVMEFEKLNDQFIILEDHSTPAQQADFRRASQNMKVLHEQGGDVNENARTQLQQLGALAPIGTKATVVATTILDQTGTDTYSGSLAEGQSDRYTLSRDVDGTVTIRDNQEGFDILLAHDGKIQAAMSDENLQHFSQLYDRLDVKQQAAAQSRSPTAVIPQSTAEELDRQDAQTLQDRPEYAPLMQSVQAVAQETQTLPEFCQELERRGIHSEVTLKDGQLEGIAYQYEGKWIPGQTIGERYTLPGVQHHLGVDAQSDRDIPLLRQEGYVYRDITQAVQPTSAAETAASSTQAVEDGAAGVENVTPESVSPAPATKLTSVAPEPPLNEPTAKPTEQRDRESNRTVNVEHLGELEQSIQQDSSPSVAEINEWLLAAQTLGKSSEEIDHIKQIGRQATANTSQSFSSLYRDKPNWRNPDFAMLAQDRQKMQDDLTVFRELKREFGEAGAVRLYQAQQSAETPIKIDQSEDFTQLREILNADGKAGVTEIHRSPRATAQPTDFNSDSKRSLRRSDQER